MRQHPPQVVAIAMSAVPWPRAGAAHRGWQTLLLVDRRVRSDLLAVPRRTRCAASARRSVRCGRRLIFGTMSVPTLLAFVVLGCGGGARRQGFLYAGQRRLHAKAAGTEVSPHRCAALHLSRGTKTRRGLCPEYSRKRSAGQRRGAPEIGTHWQGNTKGNTAPPCYVLPLHLNWWRAAALRRSMPVGSV